MGLILPLGIVILVVLTIVGFFIGGIAVVWMVVKNGLLGAVGGLVLNVIGRLFSRKKKGRRRR